MNYLLDTCVISELTKPISDARVTSWLENTPTETMFLSVVTIGEIRKGLTKLPDSKKKTKLENWLSNLVMEYSDCILAIDLTMMENWGFLQGRAEKAGTPMSSMDSLIAATVYTHNLILVTRNEKDFVPSQVPIVNPWKS